MFRNVFVLGCMTVEVSVASSIWGVNVDTPQGDPRRATNFELLLQGDVTSEINDGGLTSVTNPFSGPTRSSQVFLSNTLVTFSSSVGDSIGPDSFPFHFGVFGDGVQPAILKGEWSYDPPQQFDDLPFGNPNLDYLFPNNSVIQDSNQGSSPIDLSEAGYILSPTLIPLESLNRSLMPPSSFNPLPVFDGTYAPGQSRTFFVPNPSHEFIIFYQTATFHGGPPSGDPQTGSTGAWTEVGSVPEPHPGFLLCAGLAALYFGRHVSRLRCY
jgi:hypothetical protein